MDLAAAYRDHIAKLCAQYDTALGRCGFDGVVLHSGSAATKTASDDQAWPLRLAPHFQHWLPLCEPGCAVVYRPGVRPTLHRPDVDDIWEGQPPACDAHVLSAFEVTGSLPRLGAGRWALIAEGPAPAGLGALCDGEDVTELRAALDLSRSIKTPYEQHCVAMANRTAAVGHVELSRRFAADDRRDGGDSELTLHLAYLAATRQDDSWTPYKNIVATGRSAAVLHHVHYATSAAPAETSLLVDAGATFRGYHSDVTRTAVRGDGADAHAFGELVDAMDRMQRAICDEIVPGQPYEQLHDRAHHHLARLLLDVGLCRGDADELVHTGVTRAFFPHGLGHSLGLQTHDVGCRPRPPAATNPYLRNTSAITAGQVFTIEPGCYFIDALLAPLRQGPLQQRVEWARVEQLAPFGGVRIEDDVLVTTGGHDNLTRAAFAALDDA